MKIQIAALIFAALSAPVFAHSDINKTIPSDGDVLASAPAVIGLAFADDIRLTRVKLTYGDEALNLDLGSQTSFRTEYSVPMPAMGSGMYQVEWRGLGTDGHALVGGFEFVVE